MPADWNPDAIRVLFCPNGAGLIGPGKGIVCGKPQIAHAATFGKSHFAIC